MQQRNLEMNVVFLNEILHLSKGRTQESWLNTMLVHFSGRQCETYRQKSEWMNCLKVFNQEEDKAVKVFDALVMFLSFTFRCLLG